VFYDQSTFDIRCDWGFHGLRGIGASSDVIVVVDVLSFCTSVDVAVTRGASIYPCRWKDERAAEYAEQLGAELAGPRSKVGAFSLSPASMSRAMAGQKIVLPSPNGAELTCEAENLAPCVIAGCFRNCGAVAEAAMSRGKSIAVIACGERWPDGSLRPAVEDIAAAGAIIANLSGKPSPESLAAVGVWNAAKIDLPEFLAGCGSGRELIERGYVNDVEIASQFDAGISVPILSNGGYARFE
jgi:2-phosphosulfolactate phosphatase